MDEAGKLLVLGTEMLLWDNDSWGICALFHQSNKMTSLS